MHNVWCNVLVKLRKQNFTYQPNTTWSFSCSPRFSHIQDTTGTMWTYFSWGQSSDYFIRGLWFIWKRPRSNTNLVMCYFQWYQTYYYLHWPQPYYFLLWYQVYCYLQDFNLTVIYTDIKFTNRTYVYIEVGRLTTVRHLGRLLSCSLKPFHILVYMCSSPYPHINNCHQI